MKIPSPYVNKLFGLSTSLNVHSNSIRVGWRYDVEKDAFELTPYVYENGIRTINHTESFYAKVGDTVVVTLNKTDEAISLTCNTIGPEGSQFQISLRRKHSWIPVFLTHPFWGGYDAAPINMSFYVEGFKVDKLYKKIDDLFTENPTLTSVIIFTILTLLVIGLCLINVVLGLVCVFTFFLWILNDIIKPPIYQWMSKLFRKGHSNY